MTDLDNARAILGEAREKHAGFCRQVSPSHPPRGRHHASPARLGLLP